MWILDSNRRNLTEILLGNGIVTYSDCRFSEHFPVQTLSGDNVYLVWDSSPKEKPIPPCIVVVAEGHSRDFLAWTSTYFPSYRPFTAFFRVVEFQTLGSLKTLMQPPSLEGIETPCVGLIVAESLFLSSGAGKSYSLTPAICCSTVSYALARGLALGANYKELDIILSKWAIARKLTGQPDRKSEASLVKDIFRIPLLLKAEAYQNAIGDSGMPFPMVVIDACLEIRRNGRISDSTWNKLTNGIEELKAAHQQMEAPREERVRYFQRLLSEHSLSKIGKGIVEAFVCAYIADLIGPGSLSHIDLISDYATRIPATILLYGLCAGLQKKNEVLSSYNALGRRLIRDLLRHESLLAPPICDIALSELQVLLEGNAKQMEFSTFSSNRAIIELQPCVSTYFALQRAAAKQEGTQQAALFQEFVESGFRERLNRELGDYLKKASDIYRQLNESKSRLPSRADKADSKQKRKKR